MLPAVFKALRAGGLPALSACGFWPAAAHLRPNLQISAIHVCWVAQEATSISTSKQAQIDAASQIKVGDLVQGTVKGVSRKNGVSLALGSAAVPGLMHVNKISQTRIEAENLPKLFAVGETIKAIVLECHPAKLNVMVGTRFLEPTPGDMLRNKQLVWDRAEEMWEAHRYKVSQTTQQRQQQLQELGIKEGGLVQGRVVSLGPIGARIDIGRGVVAWLHMRQISNIPVDDVSTVFAVGDQVKVLMTRVNATAQVYVSTKLLEPTPGDMLRDKQLVWDRAEEMAQAYRQRKSEVHSGADGGIVATVAGGGV